jgi:hypothetical protein
MPAEGVTVAPEEAFLALGRMVLKHGDPEQIDPDPTVVETVWMPILKWAVGHHLILSTEAFCEAYRTGLTPAGAYHRDLMELAYFSMRQWSSLVRKGTYSHAWARILRPGPWDVVRVKGGEVSRPIESHDQITITLAKIDLASETEGEAEARFRQAFKSQFDCLLDAARDRMKKGENEPAPARVEREHFRWLTMFQVGEKSKNRIAKEVAKTWGAVNHGIRRAGVLLVGKDYVDGWLRKDSAE